MGNPLATDRVYTGTYDDGSKSVDNCDDWTTAADDKYVRRGSVSGGPGYWTSAGSELCSYPLPIYCVMVEKTAALSLQPATGKRLYVTKASFIPGGGIAAANAACAAEKPAGAGVVKALLATSQAAAAAVLQPETSYIRVDGTPLGSGAELIAASRGHRVATGIWQAGDGSYTIGDGMAWTGAAALDQVGTMEKTCKDWTSNENSPGFEVYGIDSPFLNAAAFWTDGGHRCSETYVHLFCAEQ